MNKTILTTYLLLIAGLLGYVGNTGLDDELNRQAQYCKMVAAGTWPDYDKTINCEE